MRRASSVRGRPWPAKSAARLCSALLFALVAGLTLLPSSAQAWWNDEWTLRKKITIDAGSSGANITDPIGATPTPVLVRLHAGNFRFAQAKDDGADLRFVAADDKTPLKYHIDKIDPLLGEALVWVAVPDLKPGAKTEIWLYYDNKKALAVADPKGTYDADTVLVYHFNERGAPAQDSTVWANGAQSVGQPADDAIIGEGLRLDGEHLVTLPASPSLALPDNAQLTWSAWFKPDALQRNAAIYSRRDGANALVIGLDDGAPFVEITNAGNVQRSAVAGPVAPGGWHHLAVAATPGLITLYLDGSVYASLSASLPALNSIALIGGDTPAAPVVAPAAPATPQPQPSADAQASSAGAPTPAPSPPLAAPVAAPTAAAPAAAQTQPAAAGDQPANAAAPATETTPPATETTPSQAATPAPAAAMTNFVGELDELEIAKVTRSAGFIRLAAIDQGSDPSKLMLFSVDEETASWLSGYFAVILKSVTLDGWVVIGILMVMLVISVAVMIDKAMLVGRQAKANAIFQETFRHIGVDLALLGSGDIDAISTLNGRVTADNRKRMAASSLYRVYRIGADEVHRRFADPRRAKILSAQAIASIRAALDGGLVRENQRLNRLMVLLTIAISGGPFLGLLGTVVGVMITFAAIAESGDVNVNAIAPGIAAALVATVAGLAVAIPSLFGYNYLISRIKNLSTDMLVFVDEFTAKVAEVYDAGAAEPPQSLAAE
jgi:biopolymer transport protein ExbB